MLASKAEENCKVLCSQQGIELSWSLKYIKLFKLGRLVKNHKSARKQGRKLSCAAHALSFICDQAQRELAFGKLQSVCRWWGRLNTREAQGWWSNATMTGNTQFLIILTHCVILHALNLLSIFRWQFCCKNFSIASLLQTPRRSESHPGNSDKYFSQLQASQFWPNGQIKS